MITVKNSLIPFNGYCAIAIWPFIFVREGKKITDTVINHERIHGRQQIEMLIVPFFLWYLVEWVVKLFLGSGNAYHRISFEREAFENEKDFGYLKNRKHYAWIRFLFNN